MWKNVPPHLINNQRHFIGRNKLAASYRRCLEAGIDPGLERIGATLDEAAFFTDTISQYADLISYTRRCVEDVHLTMSDRSCIFILTDSGARVIDIFSLPEILNSCSSVGIVPGASLKEESCGTNAVALALHHCEPIVTSGEDHFCKIFKDWSFITVPIYGAACEPIACITLASGHDCGIHEKLPLVKLMAEKIESGAYGDGRSGRVFMGCDMCPNKNEPPPMADDSLKLSPCQNHVFSLVREGYAYKEVADKLNISYHTVKTQMERLRKKLGVKNSTEMVAKYGNKVVCTPPPPEHADPISNVGNFTYGIEAL